MKTTSEYLLPRPGDPIRRLRVHVPRSCAVMLYEPDERNNGWRIVVKVRALDVKTGEDADFETRWDGGFAEPTQAQIAQVVINMLAHEIQEQFGLNPHGGEVVIPEVRQR